MAFQCLTQQFLRNIKPKLQGQMLIQHRNSSYIGSKLIGPLSQYTDVEVSKNPEEWKFVERLLAPKYVPKPEVKELYPSGWTPTKSSAAELPFFVERSRNHQPPIYLDIQYRGDRRVTILKKVRGDIWALEADLKQYLNDNTTRRVIITQVNELSGLVRVKGDYVALVEQWFLQRGF